MLRRDFPGQKVLRSIKVYRSTPADTLVCDWRLSQHFLYSAAGSIGNLQYEQDKYRMFLDSIEKYSVDTKKQTFRMGYNSTLLPCRKSFGKDLWGYYNGHNENPNSMYVNDFDIAELSRVGFPTADIYNNRKGDEQYIQAGILTKLEYPAGGYSIFEYEGHQISPTEKAGGLRVRSIRNYANDTLVEVKNFKYGLKENGLAKISTFNYNKNFRSKPSGSYYLNTDGKWTTEQYIGSAEKPQSI